MQEEETLGQQQSRSLQGEQKPVDTLCPFPLRWRGSTGQCPHTAYREVADASPAEGHGSRTQAQGALCLWEF